PLSPCHRASCSRAKSRHGRRPGMVLIVVLVAIMMLTLAGLTFAQLMLAEREAAWAHGRAVQSRALVDSGVAWIEQQVAQPGVLEGAGGHINNQAVFGPQVVVDGGIDRDRGRFCVLAHAMQAGVINGVRYGLEDESARLNLNTLLLADPTWQSMAAQAVASTTSSQTASTAQTAASAQTASSAATASTAQGASTASSGSTSSSGGSASSSSSTTQVTAQQALMGLPGMTAQIADCILDWLDPDDVPRPNGAERDFYTSRGYAPKNGPFETVEELLLVNGVTPQLLFGQDIDRNGNIDQDEAKINIQFPASTGSTSSTSGSSSSSGSSTSSSGGISGLPGSTSSNSSAGMLGSASMTQGWSAYLTVYSHESNLRHDGQPKININAIDLQQLYQALSGVLGGEVATFIIAYRQGKVVTGSQTTVSIGGNSPDFTKPGNTLLASPLDLVGCKVQVTFQGSQQASVVNSPFDSTPQVMAGYIPMLFDTLTIVPATTVPGRININLAPLTVLMTIPGMDANTASMILTAQQTSSGMLGSNRNYPTWLYTEGLLTLDAMKKLMPFVTCGGRVYRAQVVGYFDAGGPVSRAEVVIDATTIAPRLLLWRELTHLGLGYSRAVLGIRPKT
ncbi:MAG: general secretion pathway protein GspK, partial [Pirellulales bacterium]